MALSSTQVANRKSLGLPENATTGQVFDVIESQLRGGISGTIVAATIINQHDSKRSNTSGQIAHSMRTPVRSYTCADCGSAMTKHGSGLGKWKCNSNKTHTRAKVSTLKK